MTSGQMWNHIRGPPYAHKNPHNGQVVSVHFLSINMLNFGHERFIYQTLCLVFGVICCFCHMHTHTKGNTHIHMYIHAHKPVHACGCFIVELYKIHSLCWWCTVYLHKLLFSFMGCVSNQYVIGLEEIGTGSRASLLPAVNLFSEEIN